MVDVSVDPKELAKELGPAADASIGPFVGVASIALNMSMKYHDIATVQDGTLYQQYKLEGRNLMPLHIDMVFETAIQIEKHLIGSHKRIADALLLDLVAMDAQDDEKAAAAPPADGGSEKR